MRLPRANRATLPREQCYWAILQGSGAKGLRGRKRNEALLYELERSLPIQVESVSASFAAHGGGIVACAAQRTMIDDFRRSCDSLTPDALPDELAGGTLNTASFELLGGRLMSARHARLKRVRRLSIETLAIAASTLITAGLAVRTHRLNTQSEKHPSQIEAAYEHAIDLSVPSLQPAGVRLVTALREAEKDTETAAGTPAESSVLPAFLHMLSQWPEDATLRLERLTVGAREASLDVSLDQAADVSQVLAALSAPPGWTARSPRIQQRRDGQSLQISYQQATLQESSR